tara:strand:- start:543 stop:830 length:288 start_codon:yes stop_codon:yes gene_type:complete
MLICSNKIREKNEVYIDGIYYQATEIKSQRRILRRVGYMNYESVEEKITKRLSNHRYEVIAKSSFEAEILVRELFECNDDVFVHEISRFRFIADI